MTGKAGKGGRVVHCVPSKHNDAKKFEGKVDKPKKVKTERVQKVSRPALINQNNDNNVQGNNQQNDGDGNNQEAGNHIDEDVVQNNEVEF